MILNGLGFVKHHKESSYIPFSDCAIVVPPLMELNGAQACS